MYKVLIVDDEPAVCEGLSLLMEWGELGFEEPEYAYSGGEALTRLEYEKFHLIITDISMPGVNGLELLEEITRLSAEVKTLIISSHAQFDYARTAIGFGVKGYILKPIDRHEMGRYLSEIRRELDEEVDRRRADRKQRQMEKDQFLFDLVSGRLGGEAVARKADETGLKRLKGDYYLALIKLPVLAELSVSDETALIRSAVRKVAEGMLAGENVGLLYEDAEGMLGLLLEQKWFSAKPMRGFLAELQERVLRETRQKAIIAYCGQKCPIQLIKDSRKRAAEAMERWFMAGETVFSCEEVLSGRGSELPAAWNAAPLLAAVENADTTLIAEELEHMTAFLPSPMRSETYGGAVHYVLFELCALIKRSGGNPDAVYDFSSLRRKLTGKTEHLGVFLGELCAAASDYLQSLRRGRQVKAIDQVKEYIDEHFRESISIKEIARMFYLNPAYLGQLFIRSMGVSISDYINKRRIDEVKRLTAIPGGSVSEALDSVGYNNYGYFYRKFRKLEGVPFSEFSTSLRDNAEE